MNMNKTLQIIKFKELLKANEIEPDLIDLEKLVDEKLHYYENREIIENAIGMELTDTTTDKEAVEIIQAQSNAFAYEQQKSYKISLSELFKKHNIIGLVGNRNTAKSSLALSELIALKKEFPNTNVYVFGVEETLKPYLTKCGIKWLFSKHDILDMKIKNSVIFIDEVGQFFSTETRDKETDKIKRFINRINHLNNFVIMGTAQVSWWNKLACSLIDAFLVKKVDFSNLTNGTWLKERVEGLETTSDYRLDIENNEYFIISEALTEKKTFEYNPELDSKKNLINPFKKSETKSEEKGE